MKAKFVAGKLFMVQIQNRKFIKDSITAFLAEATFNHFIRCAGSSEMRFHFYHFSVFHCLPKMKFDQCLQVLIQYL